MKSSAGSRRFRRKPHLLRWALAGLLALVAVLGLLALNPNALAPLAERIATNSTGLPAVVGGMAIRYLPWPVVTLRDVQLGDQSFGLSVEEITAPVSLAAVWRAAISVPQVTLKGTQLWLPKEGAATAERFGTVVRVGREEAGGAGPSLEVETLEAGDVTVYQDGVRWATGSVLLQGVTQPTLTANLDLMAEADGTQATLGVEATYEKPTQRLNGQLSMAGPVRNLLTTLGEQDLSVELKGEFDGSFEEQVAARVEGSFESALYGQQGTLAGLAFWKDGLFIVNDLAARSNDCDVSLDVTVTPDVEAAFEIYKASIGPQTLRLLAAALMPAGIQTQVGDDASMKISELLGAYPLGDTTAMRFERGTVAVKGLGLSPAEGAAPFPPLAALELSALLGGNVVRIEQARAEGMAFTGNVSVPAEGGLVLQLAGTVELGALELSRMEAFDSLRGLKGSIAIETLRVAVPQGEATSPDVQFKGEAKDVGFSVTLPGEATPLTTSGIQGGIGYDGSTLTLENVRGDGLTLNGFIGMPNEAAPAPFQLSGDIELSHPMLAAVIADAPVSHLGGSLKITRLEGAIDPVTRSPINLIAEASLKDGRGRVTLGDTVVNLTDMLGNFTTAEGQVKSELSLNSPELGGMKWSGSHDIQSLAVEGALDLNVAQVAGAFAPAFAASALGKQVAAAYGTIRLDINAQLPSATMPPALRFEHAGAPPLSGSINYLPAADGTYDIGADLQADIPLDGVSVPGALPIAAAGIARVQLAKSASETTYTINALLDDADLRVGEYLRKQPGQALRAHVTLSSEGLAEQMTVVVLDQSLQFAGTAGGWEGQLVSLDLARLAPLFTGDVATRGSVSGALRTSPMSVDLKLLDVAVALTPEVRVENMSGGLRYDSNVWQFDQLRVQAADSDLLLDAGRREGAWRGTCSGRRLNLDAVLAMRAAWSPGGGSSEGADGGLEGALDLRLDEVLFRQTQFSNVTGTLKFAPGRVELANLNASAGGGAVAGSIVYTSEGQAGVAAVQLTTTAVDASVFDAVLFPQPRGLRGAVDARVNIRFPLAADMPPYNGLTGDVTFEARRGTFGQAGFATRLLSVLRTTEVLRLRMPGFGDGGLAFDQVNAVINARQGVVTLESFTLTATSYAFDALGTVDFPRDQTNIEGRMHLMESVTGIVSSVPILGSVVDRVKERTGVAFVMTGSPFDIKVTPKPGTRPLRDTREGIKESIGEIKSIGDALGF